MNKPYINPDWKWVYLADDDLTKHELLHFRIYMCKRIKSFSMSSMPNIQGDRWTVRLRNNSKIYNWASARLNEPQLVWRTLKMSSEEVAIFLDDLDNMMEALYGTDKHGIGKQHSSLEE